MAMMKICMALFHIFGANHIYIHPITIPSHLGGGEGTATRRLPRDPCDISIGLSRIRFDNVCV